MLRDKIALSIKRALGENEVILDTPEVEVFGDYTTNLAMIKAKKEGKNPLELAKSMVENLRKNPDFSSLISKIEIAGPGFINFWLAKEVLIENLREIDAKKDKYGSSEVGKGKTVVIDYSSPNIAKRFAIGHLRSTVIGQALYNLYKFLGYNVIGDNHLGDWGTQFGTLLYQIDSKGLSPEKLSIDELEKLYVDFNNEAQDNEKLWERAREWFKKLEEGDPKATEIWQKVVSTSMDEFDRIYELLGVKIDYAYGESFYQDKMPGVVKELKEKNLIKDSEGAEIIEFADIPPAMVTKSDGTTTYFTRDLATVKYRIETWNPDIFIYEVGSDQILHFRQIFETAKLLGWNDKRHYEHVAHGLIRFSFGKMSTREGKTVKLEDVLDEAVQRAWNIIEKSETGRGLTKEEREKVASSVGVGAVKYFDLIHHPKTDIVFDWEKVFILEGNSAPYMQYTNARINSVIAKAGSHSAGFETKELNPEELSLLTALSKFSEVVLLASESYSPNLLSNYLFSLAQKYNNYYNQHRIIGSGNEAFGLALSRGAGIVLTNGLKILGIEAPERM